jgi:hypothetical protein
VIRNLRQLHSDKLHDFCSSPVIIRVIRSRRMRWAGHVARTAETRNAYRILVGRYEGKGLLEDLELDGGQY